MRFIFGLWIAFIGSVSFASSSDDRCRETREAHAQISAHISNFMNVGSTRTPDGGPYKPWSCSNQTCVQMNKPPLLKYEPGHPDADENGMVAYPNVNGPEEFDAIMANYAELSILAKMNACGATYVDAGDVKGIIYDEHARVWLDRISFVTRDGFVQYVFSANRKMN